MNYQPTHEESRWLRRWKETGRILTGEASVKTQADFTAMQRANLQLFSEWASNLVSELSPDRGTKMMAPVAKERKPRYVSTQAVELQTAIPDEVTTQDGASLDLFVRDQTEEV